MVFQDFRLLYDRNVFENVALPLRLVRTEKWELTEKVEKILDKVGLIKKMEENPSHLSGGEKQRVAIARALVHEPRLLIADEPTGNLDWKLSGEIMELFEESHEKGTTLLIATHDREMVKERGVKRLIELKTGRIFEQGGQALCGQFSKPLQEAGLSIL